MLARWPSKQDHKGDNVGELIASLCTKYSMSDLRQHKKMVRWLLIKGHEFPSVGLGSAEGLDFHCRVRVEESKEVTWGNLLWYTGLNWKLCFLSWIHISSWRAPVNILLASPGGYRVVYWIGIFLLGEARLILMSCQKLSMCGPKSHPFSEQRYIQVAGWCHKTVPTPFPGGKTEAKGRCQALP